MKKLIIIAAAALLASGGTIMATEHFKSLDKDNFDTSVQPGTDFYQRVNGGWMKKHPLTPEYSRFSQFNLLADTAQLRIKDIVTNVSSTNPAPGTVAFKVATVYEQAMDSVRLNREGAAPIKPILKKIEDTPANGMEDLFIWMQTYYGSPFVGASIMEDMTNSNQYAMYIGADGLGMGDRDYYLLNDKRNKEVRDAYKKLIVSQMMNAGYKKKDAERIMKNVMKIETLIADSTWTREQSRNIPAMYNPMTIDQLKAAYPAIKWDRMFIEPMGIPTPEMVIVTTPNTVKQCNDLYAKLTDREKKDYYLWAIVMNAASKLSDDFINTNFEFSKVMSGVQQLKPRWKRAISATEGALGEAIGELYVAKYFPPSSKAYMLELVENLRTALGKHIIDLDWMSTETKLNAIKKLNAITVKIGYPDKWKDYTTMEIDPAKSYYENMHNVSLWYARDLYSKWGKPVDKTEWGMTPQTVNAYYNPLANEIVFPAGILSAPYFDPESSDAENYGAIGVVIGHEMTHGFDDQGRNFDADGNMTDWWTEADTQAFTDKTKGLIEQFNKVEILPGLNANGEYTLGENIADQGGLRVALTAFLDSQKKKGVDVNSQEALIDGYTPLQTFYMNYANVWANNIREAEMRNLTTGDVHSLGKNRVNVTLRNLQPFFEAFSITEGQPMWLPEKDRVLIW